MSRIPPENAGRSIQSEDFHRFLAWLAPDADEAGDRYNHIRLGLIRMFASRGCGRPEDLADRALDRVIRKIDVVAPGYEGNPAAYVHGVAKKVFLEYLRERQRSGEAALPDLGILRAATSGEGDPERERRHACLEHCLAELPEEDRVLILRYYREERWAKIEDRQVIAEEAVLSRAALRKRTQRIRERLKACLARRAEER